MNNVRTNINGGAASCQRYVRTISVETYCNMNDRTPLSTSPLLLVQQGKTMSYKAGHETNIKVAHEIIAR